MKTAKPFRQRSEAQL